jgi:hypothetical protein
VTAYPDFARMDQYIDSEGTRWSRRGGTLVGKALGRRLRDQQTLVLHHYLGELNDVPATAREAFWAEAEGKMAASGFSDFTGIEFKDEARRHLLVISESC